MPRRRQFSNQQLLDQLDACAQRLGHSPTEKELNDDPLTISSGVTIRKRCCGERCCEQIVTAGKLKFVVSCLQDRQLMLFLVLHA